MSIVYLRNCTVLFAVRPKCYAEVASSSRVNLSSGISEASIFIYSPFPWNSMLTFFITGSCVLYFTAFLLHTVSREQPINIFFYLLCSLYVPIPCLLDTVQTFPWKQNFEQPSWGFSLVFNVIGTKGLINNDLMYSCRSVFFILCEETKAWKIQCQKYPQILHAYLRCARFTF